MACCALTLPSGAIAQSRAGRYHEHDHAVSAEFTAPGTNGYSLDVKSEMGVMTITAADELPPVATISAGGRLRPANRSSIAASTYTVFGQSRDPNAIDADLGPLGRISVVFQPSGAVHVNKLDLSDKSKRCVAPRRIVRRLGTFTGRIEFAGENGFTTVNLTSARGSVGTSPFRDCTTLRHQRAPEGPLAQREPPGATLQVINRAGADRGASASMFAATAKGREASFFAAMVEPITPGLVVYRTAQASAGRSSFVFHDPLTFAAVTPPAPFSGRALFHRKGSSGGSGRWSGTLRVHFPGFEVPVTGPTFSARLYPLR